MNKCNDFRRFPKRWSKRCQLLCGVAMGTLLLSDMEVAHAARRDIIPDKPSVEVNLEVLDYLGFGQPVKARPNRSLPAPYSITGNRATQPYATYQPKDMTPPPTPVMSRPSVTVKQAMDTAHDRNRYGALIPEGAPRVGVPESPAMQQVRRIKHKTRQQMTQQQQLASLPEPPSQPTPPAPLAHQASPDPFTAPPSPSGAPLPQPEVQQFQEFQPMPPVAPMATGQDGFPELAPVPEIPGKRPDVEGIMQEAPDMPPVMQSQPVMSDLMAPTLPDIASNEQAIIDENENAMDFPPLEGAAPPPPSSPPPPREDELMAEMPMIEGETPRQEMPNGLPSLGPIIDEPSTAEDLTSVTPSPAPLPAGPAEAIPPAEEMAELSPPPPPDGLSLPPGLQPPAPFVPLEGEGETEEAAPEEIEGELPEIEMAALPMESEAAALDLDEFDEGDLIVSIKFSPTESELPVSEQRKLTELARQLAEAERKVSIIGYAGGSPEQASVARRVSLARALAVRSYLIDKGVSNLKINVQAKGNKIPSGDPERADIFAK